MNQVIGRLDREGQAEGVTAYFPVIDDGADPFMIGLCAVKTAQHEGIIEGKVGETTIFGDGSALAGRDRIREMAEGYLASIGEASSGIPLTGLVGEVVAALGRLKITAASERVLQEAVFDALPGLVPDAGIEREVRFGERSRLDFLVTRGDERVAIECKMESTGRSAVYRQVRRYIDECDVTAVVLLAPWSGVGRFAIGDVPVAVVDWTKRGLQ
jgi:hypothetical protein